jgi:tRNA(Arg) A34 adenosine deaminase TadA
MALVVELARQNVRRRTGGPFAAGVFDANSHTLIAPIMFAERFLRTYDLGGPGRPPCELTTSAAPCAMCLGAIPWSGVRRVVCAARDEDARAMGFDEGDKPVGWVQKLEGRGIAVIRDVRRDEAVQVLREYVRGGGLIYNSRRMS